MGTEGMKYSLVSREVIADSIETVAGCEGFDGLVAIGGCDKNMPGCLIALARLNRPAVFVYGGTILPGCLRGKNLDIVCVFEAVGQHAAGKIDDERTRPTSSVRHSRPRFVRRHVHRQHHGLRHRGARHEPAQFQRADRHLAATRNDDCRRAGAAVLDLIARKHPAARHHDARRRLKTPSRSSSRSAARPTPCCTCSPWRTPRRCRWRSTISPAIGKHVPVLADLKPSGKHVMAELVAIGGLLPLMKMLLDRGLLHGDCLTVTGKTAGGKPRRRAAVSRRADGDPSVRQSDQARQPSGHPLRQPRRRPARWPRSPARKGCASPGTARVFESEETRAGAHPRRHDRRRAT